MAIYRGVGGRPQFTKGDYEAALPIYVPVSCYMKHNGSLLTLPNEPESITYDTQPLHNVEYNIYGDPIIRFAKFAPMRVMIAGRTGSASRLHYIDRSSDIVDPLKIIQDFFNKIEDFTVTNTNRKTTKQPYGISFYDLINGRILTDCQIVSLNVNQDVGSTRLGYEWSIELIAYTGSASIKPLETAWDKIIGVVTTVLNKVTVFLNGIESIVDGAREYAIAPIKKALGAFRRAGRALGDLITSGVYTVGEIRRTLDDVRDSVSAVIHSVAVSIASIKRLWEGSDAPFSSSQYWKNLWNDWADASQLTDSENEGTPRSEDVTLSEMGMELEQAAYELEVAIGYAGYSKRTNKVLPVGSGGSFLDKAEAYQLLAQYSGGRVPTFEAEGEASYIPYTLRMDDNLYTVAARVLGDAGRWDELAQINGWQDAKTLPSGEITSGGVKILVPDGDEGAPSQYLNDRSSVLLSDLRLTADGDLDLSRSLSDAALVHGEDNLSQALINRLRTNLRELPYQPDYGLETIIGAQNNDRTKEALTLEIIGQLSADERVALVSDVVIVTEGDTAHAELNIVSILGDSVNMILPL